MEKNTQLALYIVLSIVIIAGASIIYNPNNVTGKQFYIFSQARQIDLLANKEFCIQDSECFSTYCLAGRCTRPYVLFSEYPCSEDKQCRTGFCHTGRCTSQYTLSPRGSPCEDSRECQSKACNEGKCIPGNFPIGTSCSVEEQCISQFCFSGKCSVPWTLYTDGNCIENKQCQSSICNLGKCQPRLGSQGPILVRDLRGIFATGSIFN